MDFQGVGIFLRYFFFLRILSYFIQYWKKYFFGVGGRNLDLTLPFSLFLYPPLKWEFLLQDYKTLSFCGLEGLFQGKIGEILVELHVLTLQRKLT